MKCLICNKRIRVRKGRYRKYSDDCYDLYLSCKKCSDVRCLRGR